MKKLALFIIVILLCSGNLFAHVQDDLKRVLQTKDFTAFTAYIDSLPHSGKNIKVSDEILRTVTDNFQEGMYVFEQSFPDKDNSAISTIYTFRVNIIVKNTEIVFYNLGEKKNKNVDNDWKSFYDLIDQYKNIELFESLKKSFKAIFHADLNESELFITDMVYGDHCGFAGVNPEGRQQIENWVTKKNKTALINWLKSTNTEKQVYAVDGLHQLNAKGIKLTQHELEMIEQVKNKEGIIKVCNGCVYSISGIKIVTSEFKFL